ncbi:hypothetical protein Ancab_025636 [Ancistrocladus abbreviatus]
MAGSVVESAVNWLGKLLVEEAKYLRGVKKKVEQLREELLWMQCFLRSADACQRGDAMVRMWVGQMRDYTYDAEDIIAKYLLEVGIHRRGGLVNSLRRFSRILWMATTLHKIGSNIDSLREKISSLTSRLQTYGIKIKGGDSPSSSYRWLGYMRRTNYLHDREKNEEKIVGLDNDVRQIVGKLLSNESKSSTVVAICGMVGSGKTTLAKKVYHDRAIRRSFNAFAWVDIHRECQTRAVLEEAVRELTSESGESIAKKTDKELMEELRLLQLEKKCLIVLDDVWSFNACTSLKAAFLVGEQSSQSSLLFTTCDQEVASHAAYEAFIHEPHILDDDESWELLQTKLGGAPTTIYGNDNGPAMENMGKEMLKHCYGLPLAIIVLGGVLAAKITFSGWEMVNRSITSYLSRANGGYLSCKQVLDLSYYDLPYRLKPCFLYLGNFPSGWEFDSREVVHLWIAEGLVSVEDEGSDETLMEVADHYLAELVERSMVQVVSRGVMGRMKTCRLHELMRELCLSKAIEENFLQLVAHRPSNSLCNIKITNRARHLAIYYNDSYPLLDYTSTAAQQIRSLSFFNSTWNPEILSGGSKQLKIMLRKFKLLRVLHLRHSLVYFPKQIGNLIHLRYLSIEGCELKKLPSSIGNLRCLETLDLRARQLIYLIMWIPNVLWRLEQLRHLYLPLNWRLLKTPRKIKGVPIPEARFEGNESLQLDGLTNLQTLSNFDVNQCRVEDLLELPNLRKFSVKRDQYIPESKFGVIDESPSFQSGHLKGSSLGIEGELLKKRPRILFGYHHLRKLWVEGRMLGLKTAHMLPENLTMLSLHQTEIKSDPMPVLEKLPYLSHLELLSKSYIGKEMICSTGGFPSLVNLELSSLNIEDWIVEQGAMPSLVHLKICNCRSLKMIPHGLKYVIGLEQVNIENMPESF